MIGFSVWNEQNECLSWSDTKIWLELLDIPSVPVLYKGTWDETVIRSLYNSDIDIATREGYVVRLADSFHYKDFKQSVAKFVRKDHVSTSKHWMYGYGKTHESNGLKNA